MGGGGVEWRGTPRGQRVSIELVYVNDRDACGVAARHFRRGSIVLVAAGESDRENNDYRENPHFNAPGTGNRPTTSAPSSSSAIPYTHRPAHALGVKLLGRWTMARRFPSVPNTSQR